MKKISFVNISLSTQIRDNPEVYTPEKINALFEQYKAQLKQIIQDYDTKYSSQPFSVAHTYNISFELLKKIVLGDVNNDGAVNINDVTDIQRNLAELEEFDEYQQLASDANQDGAPDISDATAIQMYLADYKLPYPIGQVLK